MDIKSKLLLSDASPLQVHWFREHGRLRLYQGALSWAAGQGLLVQLECRRSKTLASGLLLFGEYSQVYLFSALHERGLRPEPVAWGWRLDLKLPRCAARERVWLSEQTQCLPVTRWRENKEESNDLSGELRQILVELSRWPVGDLPPMQALKAIQRWQVRLRQLPPVE